MRILLAHNRYQISGGEDVVVQAERGLLNSKGHGTELYEASNTEITEFTGHVKTALGAIYSPKSKKQISERIELFQPDVVHVHNFFPLFSPSIYYSCHESGVPVVQTLHNYRLICPNAQLLREGRVCEDCVGKSVPWPGAIHGCYRQNRAASMAVATMLAVHRFRGTWRNVVDGFIAPTEFCREKHIEGGIPAERIMVKPNFVPDPGTQGDGQGGFALFVGRLSQEKGIRVLLAAWAKSKIVMPLKIAGDGPLERDVAQHVATGRIEYLGSLSREEVLSHMRKARLLIFPSICYEVLPMSILEAFSVGLPVVASGHGSMASVVEHGRIGLHFRPGDAEDLATKVEWAVAHPEEMTRMGQEARAEYLAKYTPEKNYLMLMEVYDQAVQRKTISMTY